MSRAVVIPWEGGREDRMGFGARVVIWATLALAALCLCSAALATFPGENGKIAFSRDGDIWIMDPDGSNQEQITSGPAQDSGPRWSPDGSAVAFSRQGSGHARILVYDLGGGLSRLGDLERVSDPAWSPDGQRFAVRFLGSPNKLFDFPWLSIVSRGGRVIRSHLNDQAGVVDSDWSPLGDRIAYAVGTDGMATIFSVDTLGIDNLPLSPGPRDLGDFTSDPSWAPDGSLVAFGHAQERVCEDIGPNTQRCAWPTQIYIVDADGSDLTQLTPLDGFNSDGTPAWSPEGDKILYVRSAFVGDTYADPVLRLMDANGDNIQDIGVVGSQPDWQPLVPPRNLKRPTLGGAPRVGEELVSAPGRWFGTPEVTFSYRWQRCLSGVVCENVAGATAPTYVPTTDDVEYTVRVFVTATNDQGASTAWSLPTLLVGKTRIGTAADERFEGSRGGDFFSGLGGADYLQGNGGPDILLGGDGADIINARGALRIDGGRGGDKIAVRNGIRDMVDCGAGEDLVRADSADWIRDNCETVKIG